MYFVIQILYTELIEKFKSSPPQNIFKTITHAAV